MKRIALVLGLTLSLSSVALAQTPAPGVPSPLASPSSLAAPPTSAPPPLPPRADGVPADLAFGAYQRGNFLYALLEAERRLDANPKDAAAMTLIGEIYREAPRSPAAIKRLRAGIASPATSAIPRRHTNSERCWF